jgi:small subunit ribosomal protein S24e
MRLKIIEEKENPVLKRKEMIASLDYEQGSTPSKADLQKVLSEQLNADLECIEISKILSDVGRPIGMAWIKLWREKKVPVYKKKAEAKEEKQIESPKEKQKSETKPEEQKQEEKTETTKQEEKKEEPKQEESQQEAKPEGEQ